MIRLPFVDELPVLRLTIAEFEAIPNGRPDAICEQPIGYRWREHSWAGIRIRELSAVSHDGLLLTSYRPVIRVPAVSRLVPRSQAAA